LGGGWGWFKGFRGFKQNAGKVSFAEMMVLNRLGIIWHEFKAKGAKAIIEE